MSEYQYYEFVTVDKPLSRDEMDQLRSISTRAEISSTRFCNTYNYSDLKAQPERLLADYFDAFVYVSNFAYQRFMIKLPKSCIDAKVLKPFYNGEYSSFEASGKNWLLEFCYSDENGYDDFDWIEGEGWMSQFLPIRAELMKGDYRSLYLLWLAELENSERNGCEIPTDLLEPLVPAGLDNLTASQSALCEFLRLKPYIVEAAAKHSSVINPADLNKRIDSWLGSHSLTDCQALLKTLLQDETGVERAKVIAQLQKNNADTSSPKDRRTAADLHLDAKSIKNKADKDAAVARQKQLDEHLDQIAAREPAYWNRLEELFQQRGSYAVYDELETKLKDLKRMAARENRLTAFEDKIASLRERYTKKVNHLAKLSGAL